MANASHANLPTESSAWISANQSTPATTPTQRLNFPQPEHARHRPVTFPVTCGRGNSDLWPHITAYSQPQRHKRSFQQPVSTQHAEYMLFSQGREIVVNECPNASISPALMTHWLVAVLRCHWLEQLSWSMRWLRQSQDTVAWWHWQSHHRQRPRMHRERERKRACAASC